MSDDSQWQPPPTPEDDEDEDKTIPWTSPLDAKVPTSQPQAPAPPAPPGAPPVPPSPGAPPPPGVAAPPPPGAPPVAPPPPGAPPVAGPPGASAPGASAPGAPPVAAPPGTPAPAAAPPAGAPSPFPAQGAPQAAPKKSNKGLIAAGCGGCLFILLSICCCTGYVFYLEEGISYDEPGDELERHAVVSGQQVTFSTTWEGTGYASLRMFVAIDESADDTTQITGTFGCSQYGTLRSEQVSGSPAIYPELPDGWIPVPDQYIYVRDGETTQCTGTLSSTPAVPLEVVVTEHQRPSDWFSEWF